MICLPVYLFTCVPVYFSPVYLSTFSLYTIPMFITLEGPEGSGKTSHIPYLVEYLRGKGYTVFPTREPGGTSIS